jgi:hypothetical protein
MTDVKTGSGALLSLWSWIICLNSIGYLTSLIFRYFTQSNCVFFTILCSLTAYFFVFFRMLVFYYALNLMSSPKSIVYLCLRRPETFSRKGFVITDFQKLLIKFCFNCHLSSVGSRGQAPSFPLITVPCHLSSVICFTDPLTY